MYRLVIIVCSLAVVPANLLAQTEFRAVASGEWSDSRNWEMANGGVWLKPPEGVYPGERHHRNVDVIVDRGTTVTLDEGQDVNINSLTVMEGRVVIKGLMIIGPTNDDSENSVKIIPANGGLGIKTTTVDDAPVATPSPSPSIPSSGLQLPQNTPNPVSFATGDWTTFNLYIDQDYPLVRLSIYDEMGVELQRIYEEYHPASGWVGVKINTHNLQSGSYPVVLQAGSLVLRRSLTIIR